MSGSTISLSIYYDVSEVVRTTKEANALIHHFLLTCTRDKETCLARVIDKIVFLDLSIDVRNNMYASRHDIIYVSIYDITTK
ncbi:hypothetical protein V1478_002923 [Vespula squamosa]|uniref:Uncharacterized protein n=1 Tax=Vespula squamosa TaxID=30214 RepID=A0ABD2BR82_VESSQ